MTFSLETIIYIYLFVSLCIILFNISCIIIRKREEKILAKRSSNYRNLIKDHLEEAEEDTAHLEYLQKKLGKVKYLIAFHDTIQTLLKEEEKLKQLNLLNQNGKSKLFKSVV